MTVNGVTYPVRLSAPLPYVASLNPVPPQQNQAFESEPKPINQAIIGPTIGGSHGQSPPHLNGFASMAGNAQGRQRETQGSSVQQGSYQGQ